MPSRTKKNRGSVRNFRVLLTAVRRGVLWAMKSFSRLKWRYVVIVGMVLAVAAVGLVQWQSNRALSRAAQELKGATELTFSANQLLPRRSGFEWISAPAVFSGGAIYKGDFYLAGATGLFRYDKDGQLIKHYRPGQELPPTTLLRVATGVLRDTHEQELLFATGNQGVLAFNGVNFRQIRPLDPEARSVTSLLPLTTGQLLMGTRKRGVLVYDGQKLHAFHASLSGLNVTDLAGSEGDLWVGTQDRGVAHFQAGRMQMFSEAQGLPDPQVFSIALAGQRAYVGTAAGIAEFQAGRFVRVLAPGVFARALYANDQTVLAGGNDGITEVNLSSRRRKAVLYAASNSISDLQQIFSSGSALYAVTSHKVYGREGTGNSWKQALSSESTLLADRNIAALSFDTSRHLWVGYFDRGIDLFSPDLRTVTHIEDDTVFCVNRVLPNVANGTVAIATANGLAIFDQLGRKQQVLGRRDGLMADHVTDVALYRDGMVLATPAGLTFLDQSGPHSLYAFHGLVNNHVYTVAAAGKEVVAGTLGGISVLENESVAANYTVASRGLTHNWISAVVRDGDSWIVGTYGGGIVRLLKNGRFESWDVATANFEVYPNAMVATDQHVLAGTLGKGLYVYNRNTNRWIVISDGLPSLTVTALTSGDGYLYVGTDNGLVRIPEQDLP
jgi:ligand-binding sensor domain-containing protein